ncbi:MAG: TraE/TraK family type IV conjugative transfer system protein [Alphaproteobacteria bacterium]|jgi:type IV conjugative transfer system protein TraE|nr:type IV conjugative transfer system protein TraE [Candidatus Jidaibacter sp.]
MNVAGQITLNKQLKKHKSVLLYSTAYLLFSNVVLCGYLISQDTKTVLVPTHINKELTLSQSHVSEEYLEVIVRDIAMQLLNLTPDTYDYVETQILKLALPSNYAHLQEDLRVLGDDIRSRNISIGFQISQIVVDVKSLECEVTGYLDTRIGTSGVARERKQYKFEFDYSASKLALKEFYEERQANENT